MIRIVMVRKEDLEIEAVMEAMTEDEAATETATTELSETAVTTIGTASTPGSVTEVATAKTDAADEWVTGAATMIDVDPWTEATSTATNSTTTAATIIKTKT